MLKERHLSQEKRKDVPSWCVDLPQIQLWIVLHPVENRVQIRLNPSRTSAVDALSRKHGYRYPVKTVPDGNGAMFGRPGGPEYRASTGTVEFVIE